jgi:hypothetical protein
MSVDGFHRFVLAWAADAATLTLPPVEAGADAGVAAALALAPALPALRALETWLGIGFERVVPQTVAGDQTRPGAQRLVVALPTLGGGGRASLDLPVSALPFGTPLPAGLVLAWPTWRCGVVVQRLPPAALQPEALEPGALVLLPQAFGDTKPWPLRLCIDAGADDEATQAPTAWPQLEVPGWQPGCSATDLGAARPRRAEQDGEGWRVELDLHASVSAGAWFAAGGSCRWPPLPATLWQGATPAAHGEFVPAGRGWALRLTHLAAARRALQT